MVQCDIQARESILGNIYQALQIILGPDIKISVNSSRDGKGRIESIFLYHALGDSPEQEFIIDLQLNFSSGTAVLFHIALPLFRRKTGLGTRIMGEIEKTLTKLGFKNISLPAEHHSTGFWLKKGYRFRFAPEREFYEKNKSRDNLHVAYELEKFLGVHQEEDKYEPVTGKE